MSNENLDSAEKLIVEELKQRTMNMNELIEFLRSHNYEEGIARYLFWRLPELGMAKINSHWHLEKFTDF